MQRPLVEPASWRDVEDALKLEAATFGADVAWDSSRVRSWWDMGAMTALVVRGPSGLVSYASAAHVTAAAFDGIAAGTLDPEQLDASDMLAGSDKHWIGIVVTNPWAQRRGAGALVLNEMVRRVRGSFLADVHSSAGRGLFEHLGWDLVREAEHPVYITTTAPSPRAFRQSLGHFTNMMPGCTRHAQ